MYNQMKVNTLFKFFFAFFLLTFSSQADAQNLLNELNKNIDLNAVDLKTLVTTLDNTAQTKSIQWDSIPVYSMTKINEVDSLGQPLLNSDGTQKFRVFLQDQFGNIRSAEAVKAQQNKLWIAIRNITAKVSIASVSVETLDDNLEGAAKGAAGLIFSGSDMEMAVLQKKSLKRQKKLLKEYQNKFNEEGYPKDAKVDLSKYKDFGLTEENTLTKSSEDIKAMCESGDYNTTDDSAWDF